MKSQLGARRAIAATVVGVLVGGGLLTVTPAGAEVATAAATSWKKIWKKELKPLADKRYYTKKQSDSTFATKTESAASAAAAQSAANSATDSKLGGYYTKAQADAKYDAAGSGYTKAESDAKYAPYPRLIKGTYFMTTTGAVGALVGADISFGYTIPAAPTVHYIPQGTVVPAGCAGTVEAPDASPGHLCVFEQLDNNASGQAIYNASGSLGASRMGALLNATATAAGPVFVYGSWAVRPASVSGTGNLSNAPIDKGTPSLGR